MVILVIYLLRKHEDVAIAAREVFHLSHTMYVTKFVKYKLDNYDSLFHISKIKLAVLLSLYIKSLLADPKLLRFIKSGLRRK